MAGWDDSRVFVDTNILFYSIDSDAGEKHVRARKVVEGIWASRKGIVSAQILSEWTVNLKRKLDMQWRSIDRIIRPYLVWTVVSIEPGDTLEAIRIASRHGISYWDGLVVRAARKARANFLLTEDLNPGQKIEGIEVANPLA